MSVSLNDLVDIKQRLATVEREQELVKMILFNKKFSFVFFFIIYCEKDNS